MRIYVVSHYYDNGESYEDYRDYEEHKLYSTLQIASEHFWASVVGDYEGKYVLTEWELDTQEKEILEESAWVECKRWYSDEWQGDYEPEYDDEWHDCSPDPSESYKEYWKWEDSLPDWNDDISEEEDRAWREYVTTPGTNYREWKECEEEIKKRKSDILLDKLNSALVELLN